MNLAKELRIGNIVLYEGVKDVIWRVEENNYVTDNYGHGATDEFLEPIPLTEEWLLKFGFKSHLIEPKVMFIKIGSGFIHIDYEDNILAISNSISEFKKGEYYENINSNIKHVHTLQNLYFALTGKELEITNDTKNS